MTKKCLITFCNLGFAIAEQWIFLETIAVSDFKVGRYRQQIELMKIYVSIQGQDNFLTLA